MAPGQSGRPRHPAFHRAGGEAVDLTVARLPATGSCTSRPARTSLSTKTSALSGPGAPMRTRRARTMSSCHLRQRQRPVHQPSRRQARHERAKAELDAEELSVLGDRHGRCLRLRSSHGQPSHARYRRDDHLPVARGHRDDGPQVWLQAYHVHDGRARGRAPGRTARRRVSSSPRRTVGGELIGTGAPPRPAPTGAGSDRRLARAAGCRRGRRRSRRARVEQAGG